jgi:hypothetical protein
MRRSKAIALLLILIPALGLAQKKTKKHNDDVPAIFQYAHYIYVEALDGDLSRPGLYSPDRQAISDVEDGLRDWNRYTLANRRNEADVVLVVRKGRLANAQAGTGVSLPAHLPGGSAPNAGRAPGQPGDTGGFASQAEVGPENDMLCVYLVNPEGKLQGPLWSRDAKDGLDAPDVALLQILRTAVERTYPSQPPAPKPTP